MTNWRGPAHVIADTIAHVKSVHTIGGLYLWEFFLSLTYEYAIITGKRKITRASLLFMGCRWCTLLVVILEFVAFDSDMSRQIDCQALVTIGLTFASLSSLFASALVILRIYALWEQNNIVIAISSTIWLANAVSYVYSLATMRGHRFGDLCVIDNILHTRRSGIWGLLYTQGLAWVALFTLVEVPPMVFIMLNLNDPMDLMFMAPGAICTTVGASRMYLWLVNSAAFNSPPTTCDKEQSARTRVIVIGPLNSTEDSYDGGGAIKHPDCTP
ncbi:hypothetical protein BC826DRAFT_520076 [Russula brevipes]|nr:hypothetical protein BC826DRAFT_520076 [Russula brevipes]